MKKAILISIILAGLMAAGSRSTSMMSVPEGDELSMLAAAVGDPPEISAQSALIADLNTRKIIYEKDAGVIRQIASLAKIMTAVVLLENKGLDEVVRIRRTDRTLNSWLLNLRKDQKISVRDLLLAFMLESRNDAALYAAESVKKSEDEFVTMMNRKAEELGADNTVFTNCHGLEVNSSNFSTAYDILKITRYALENPVFREIVQMKEADIKWTGNYVRKRHLKNVNRMLFMYDGVSGVKTGYTKQAGKCITVTCKRDGREVICILLGSKDIWKDSPRMLDFAFAKFRFDEYLRNN